MDTCGRPETAVGCFLRAQPIESYDFGWIKGVTEDGITYNILAGHCSRSVMPWKLTIRTERETYSLHEHDLPSIEELLLQGHRARLSLTDKPLCRLSDCMGYSMATSTAWFSSAGAQDIPAGEITVEGPSADEICHVEAIHRLVQALQADRFSPSLEPGWLRWGQEIRGTDSSAAAKMTFLPA
jgi:hypothetical protein